MPKWCVNVTYEAAAATYTERNDRAMREGISLDDVDMSVADEVNESMRGKTPAESKSTNSRRQAVLELLKNPDRLNDVEELIIEVVCGAYLATGRKKAQSIAGPAGDAV